MNDENFTFSNLSISEASWPILIKFMCSITGGGERLRNVSRLLLIRSFLYLHVTRTCIKSRTSSNFGQIGPLTTELAALERLKISYILIMGK